MDKDKRQNIRNTLLAIVGEYSSGNITRIVAEACLELLDDGHDLRRIVAEHETRIAKLDENRDVPSGSAPDGFEPLITKLIDELRDCNLVPGKLGARIADQLQVLRGRHAAFVLRTEDRIDTLTSAHETRIERLGADLTQVEKRCALFETAIESLNRAVWNGSINECLNKHRLAIEALQRGDARAPESVHPSHLPSFPELFDSEIASAHAAQDRKEAAMDAHGYGARRERIGCERCGGAPNVRGSGERSGAKDPRTGPHPCGYCYGTGWADIKANAVIHGKQVILGHAEQRHGDPTTQALEAHNALIKNYSDVQAERTTAIRERDEARRALKCVIDERDELQHRVEVDTGALQLANREANRLRERVNPLIPEQFNGQDIADAIVHTVQMLEAQLASARDGGKRAQSEADGLRGEREHARDEGTAMQRKLASIPGLRSTIVDQARQIGELRTKHREDAAKLRIAEATAKTLSDQLGEAKRRDGDGISAREQRLRESLGQATQALDGLAIYCGAGMPGLPSLGSREQNTTTIRDHIARQRKERDEAIKQRDQYAERNKAHSATTAEQATTIVTLRERLGKIEGQQQRRDELHNDISVRLAEQMHTTAKLEAELQDVRGQLRVADADRIPLRMDLDTCQASGKIMAALCSKAQTWQNVRQQATSARLDHIVQRADDELHAAINVYERDMAAHLDGITDEPAGDDESDEYEGSFREAADNEGARLAAESRTATDPASGD